MIKIHVSTESPVCVMNAKTTCGRVWKFPELVFHNGQTVPLTHAQIIKRLDNYLDLSIDTEIVSVNEIIILYMYKLVRTCQVDCDDIHILYYGLDVNKNVFGPCRLRIGENGEYIDRWPNGLFMERSKLLF